MKRYQVTKTAPGKINLYFAVGDVRADGYHPVASLYSAVSLFEKVTVSSSPLPGISLSVSLAPGSPLAGMADAGDFDIRSVPLTEKNLAYQAAQAVIEAQGLHVEDISLHIHLEKSVPVAGGMGGGSADAAAALVATDDFLQVSGAVTSPLSLEQLMALAAPLGADVPFALMGGLAVGVGVGDELTPVSFPDDAQKLHLVMVPASFGLSTPAVFGELDRGRMAGDYSSRSELKVPDELLRALGNSAVSGEFSSEVGAYIENDLAAPACTLAPDLVDLLGIRHEQIVSAFVSGSGPTVVFLVKSAQAAKDVAQDLQAQGRYAVAVTAPADGVV